MFEPPAGYDDLLADAETAPVAGGFVAHPIEGLGVVNLRRPGPRAAAALAMSVRPKIDPATRLGYLEMFVCDHTEDGYFITMLGDMIDAKVPDDALGRLARAVATFTTARPYRAVVTLTAITAHHWRTIRTHLLGNGVLDPMGLTSLHALLDVAESMVVESIQEPKPEQTRRKRQQFFDRLYAPEPTADPHARPAGFDDDEIEAAFDSFTHQIAAES